MALDEFYDKPIADFTSPDVEQYGAPPAVELLDRRDARPWAQAAYEAGFAGIRYRLRKDPEHRSGLALFGPKGPGPKPQTQGAATVRRQSDPSRRRTRQPRVPG
jgi:hypothetical protein